MNNIVFKTQASRRPDWNRSTTPDGRYILAEVLSALIKEIRLGNEENALHWANQMLVSGAEAVDFMWESLTICALEDVGIADPNAINTVMNCRRFFDSLPPGYVGGKLVVSFVAVYLARSSKSRLVDEMLTDMLQRIEGTGPGFCIPDYALDHHTAAGRAEGRDELYFFEKASVLNNEVRTTTKYRDRIISRLRARKEKHGPSKPEVT
jgi:replication-associated recombination protein RarA